MEGADLTGADLSGANLSGANLSRAILVATDLSKANLTAASLIGAQLNSARLGGANLTEADLTGAIARKASFDYAVMHGVVLNDAELREASLYQAGLRFARGNPDLAGAELAAGDLFGAALEGAILSDADLGGVDLRGPAGQDSRMDRVDFTAARLEGANLSGVNLQRALGLTSEQLHGSFGDDMTALPPGMPLPAAWPNNPIAPIGGAGKLLHDGLELRVPTVGVQDQGAKPARRNEVRVEVAVQYTNRGSRATSFDSNVSIRFGREAFLARSVAVRLSTPGAGAPGSASAPRREHTQRTQLSSGESAIVSYAYWVNKKDLGTCPSLRRQNLSGCCLPHAGRDYRPRFGGPL